jgi:hypothetical protein
MPHRSAPPSVRFLDHSDRRDSATLSLVYPRRLLRPRLGGPGRAGEAIGSLMHPGLPYRTVRTSSRRLPEVSSHTYPKALGTPRKKPPLLVPTLSPDGHEPRKSAAANWFFDTEHFANGPRTSSGQVLPPPAQQGHRFSPDGWGEPERARGSIRGFPRVAHSADRAGPHRCRQSRGRARVFPKMRTPEAFVTPEGASF